MKPTDWKATTLEKIANRLHWSQEAGACCALQGHLGKAHDHKWAEGEGRHGREALLWFPPEGTREAG